jgi:carbon storage regulator
MLVLSRKCGQAILVPELGLALTVLDVRGDRVRLGISAPSGVIVHREEVWQRIQASAEEGAVQKTSPHA